MSELQTETPLESVLEGILMWYIVLVMLAIIGTFMNWL
jgi:hypothetical protein